MNKLEKIELDIDLRLKDLWVDIQGPVIEGMTEDQRDLLYKCVRSGYASGYHDAYLEGDQLFLDNGYPLPTRKR